MPFARICLQFPNRQTRFDLPELHVVMPMTFTGNHRTLDRPVEETNFTQQIGFTEVSDYLAEQLARAGLYGGPVCPDNPPRFEIVADAETARAIEDADRKRLTELAKGRGHALLGQVG